MRYAQKWPEYARQWNAMLIKPSREAEFIRTARKLLSHKDRYQAIERLTADDSAGKRGEGVPWVLTAILHERESSGNFDTYLGNGQSLARKTTIVPKGRGPFFGPDAFERGALDAFAIDGLSAVFDWRLEKMLYYTELFNGAGYHMKGLPSAYVWGGTNIQKPGKYVSDGVWDSTFMDTQPGTAPLLWTMARLDPTIEIIRESTVDNGDVLPRVEPPLQDKGQVKVEKPKEEPVKRPPKAGPAGSQTDKDFDPGVFRD